MYMSLSLYIYIYMYSYAQLWLHFLEHPDFNFLSKCAKLSPWTFVEVDPLA